MASPTLVFSALSTQPVDEEREQGLFVGSFYGPDLEEVPIVSAHTALARALTVWSPELVISQSL